MAATVCGRLGVKASGGIRTADAALAMIAAGATRLGLSGTRAILDGLDGVKGAGASAPEPNRAGY
jgi:deoxyribose-phosphate aldolase